MRSFYKFPPDAREPTAACEVQRKMGFGEWSPWDWGRDYKSVWNISSSVGLAASRYSISAVRRFQITGKLFTPLSVSKNFFIIIIIILTELKWIRQGLCQRFKITQYGLLLSLRSRRVKVLPLKFPFFPTGILRSAPDRCAPFDLCRWEKCKEKHFSRITFTAFNFLNRFLKIKPYIVTNRMNINHKTHHSRISRGGLFFFLQPIQAGYI